MAQQYEVDLYTSNYEYTLQTATRRTWAANRGEAGEQVVKFLYDWGEYARRNGDDVIVVIRDIAEGEVVNTTPTQEDEDPEPQKHFQALAVALRRATETLLLAHPELDLAVPTTFALELADTLAGEPFGLDFNRDEFLDATIPGEHDREAASQARKLSRFTRNVQF